MSTTGEYVPDGAGGRSRGAAGPWWWPRRRSMVLDVSLAFVSAVECLLEGAAFAEKTGISPVVTGLFGLLVGSVLVLRRRWPVLVVLVSIAVTPAQMGILLSIVGLYTLAASDVPRRIIAVLSGMTMLGMLIVTFLEMHGDLGGAAYHAPLAVVALTSVLAAVGVTAPPVLLGLYVGARRRLVESLRERADGLERELSLLAETATSSAERARMEERTRIAREMHDVVAHRVSLMVVHAAALQAIAVKDPEKASASAQLLGDMGRQALNELREMLGVLRAEPATAARAAAPAASVSAASVVRVAAAAETIAPAAPVAAAEAEEDEQGPCLAELRGLLDESRAAGMDVELTVEGEERPLAARVEATVYRVVQEALTNVHKHAPGARARIRLAYREAEVAVLVQNGPSDGAPALVLPSGGNGLVGMKERVTALGGGFAAGTTHEGGFRVSAMLPA
ncbi:histidine kinase [Actinacidiphila glaucinigra]|uniref:sensor histidine kinase n=1 Tax=Actinacidiphila glaucinigra TaxID=235986 RepID=UPI002DD88B2E|nr:histidine kinase [Actinacidiphila glaucinigra]WSD61719.1 histidine kinase [Actinacidiphila glaucinigra]